MAFVATAEAQQKVFLNKGNKTIETVMLGADDYIAFGRPVGVPEQAKVEIADLTAGKNYVRYKVQARTADQPYYQMCVSESYLKFFIMQYFGGASLSEMTEAEKKQVFSTLMQAGGYGFEGVGTKEYTVADGEKTSGVTQFVAAGETQYIVVCDLVEKDEKLVLGSELKYATVRTAEAGVSNLALSVEYLGLNAEGKPEFDVKPGNGFKSLHLVLGSTKSIDEFVNLAIQYTIKSKASSIKSARMLVMKEWDWDNALNAYDVETPSMAWADFMATTDKAEDVTEAVKQLGNKFTFTKSFSDAERDWYVAVLAVTDDYGTTVTRSTFHSHITDAEFGTLSKTFPKK